VIEAAKCRRERKEDRERMWRRRREGNRESRVEGRIWRSR
jgi:hypothetical protein